MFRRNLDRRLIVAVFVAAVGSLGMTADAKDQTWSFEKDEVGGPPAGFEFAVTAKKQPGKWIIVKDGDNQVLAKLIAIRLNGVSPWHSLRTRTRI